MPIYIIMVLLLVMGPLSLIMFSTKNLLTTLLSLELLSLALVLFIILSNLTPSNEMVNVFMILSMAGCEASIALSSLVLMLNKYGHDSLSSLMTMS